MWIYSIYVNCKFPCGVCERVFLCDAWYFWGDWRWCGSLHVPTAISCPLVLPLFDSPPLFLCAVICNLLFTLESSEIYFRSSVEVYPPNGFRLVWHKTQERLKYIERDEGSFRKSNLVFRCETWLHGQWKEIIGAYTHTANHTNFGIGPNQWMNKLHVYIY